LAHNLAGNGFTVFDLDDAVLAWALAAHLEALKVAKDLALQKANLRHGETWFVGVDALPNAMDGSIQDVGLAGPWQDHIAAPDHWHRAQLSIVYPGYPKKDAAETDANHRYRITRKAAHVDGLLPIGPDRRRYLREPHAFILGLPLNISDGAPLVVWPGSHHIMGPALAEAMGDQDPTSVDLTDAYQAARRVVFDRIEPIAVPAKPGQSMLLHRHLLHGVDVWQPGACAPPEGRMIAYFRPEFTAAEWVSP
jgi:hypothetical protein